MKEAKLLFETFGVLKKYTKNKYINAILSHYISTLEILCLSKFHLSGLFCLFGISLDEQLKFGELSIYLFALGVVSDVSGQSTK
jgi:small neutral amino acid transporter SnatA (MarC family)